MDEKLKTRIEGLSGDDAKIIEGDFERELYSTDIGEVPFAKRLFDTTPELVIQPRSIETLKKIVQCFNTSGLNYKLRSGVKQSLCKWNFPYVRAV